MKTLSMVTLILLGGLIAQAQAGGHCCKGCGCPQYKSVCRLVVGSTKVTTYKYDAICEDFCLPGKSDHCGTRCVPDCEKCSGYKKEIIWQPHCSCHIRHKKTLVKIPVTKEVPTYTCVVDRICCGCGNCCGQQQATEAQKQAAVDKATSQGILTVSAEQEVSVTLDEPAANATASTEAPKSSALNLFRFFKSN